MVTLCINKMRNDNLFYLKKWNKSYMVNQINNNNNAFKIHWDLQFDQICFLSFNFILETTSWDKWNCKDPIFEVSKMRLKSVK